MISIIHGIGLARHLNRPLRIAAKIVFGICMIGSFASADDGVDRTKLAVNRLKDVDSDFRYAGEYHGHVRGPGGHRMSVGLQVVALGDGAFQAMYYSGGLPGTGWNKASREKLEGNRAGDLLTLDGPRSRIEIVNQFPTVYDAGAIVGELRKVERFSPTLGMPAPPNAYTLFDGVHARAFKNGKITEDRLLEEGTELLARFRDFTLHVEYRLPYMPYARGQGRSNSGLYLQSSYEVQVLDSFGLEGVENECGALYRYKRPDQNMCLPPLRWQTYDITFRSPRFDRFGNKTRNARISVLHNGVVIHNDFEIERKTGAGRPEGPLPRPIKFQDHSNPVRFRNIWLIDLAPGS